MHSSRVGTVRCSGRLSCHARLTPLPSPMHATNALPAMHDPAMHIPMACMPPTMHPLPHTHAPLPCIPPSPHTCPPHPLGQKV